MPLSYAQYAGNGSATTFSVPFPYLLKAHVKLFYGYDLVSGTSTSELVDGVGFTWTTGTQVQTTVAPAVGQTLTIIRQTPTSALVVQWQDGSNLVAEDLQDSSLQTLYAVQEQDDLVLLATTQSTTAATAATAASATAAAAQATANGIAGTANTALSNSNAAVATANAASSTATAAQTTANGIAGTANTALSNANAAVTTANAASATANGIAGTANTALSNANAASTTANAASATANGIAGTANTALSNANAASTTANAASTTANAALPRSGGTMTGAIAFAAGQSISGYLPSAGGAMAGAITFAAGQAFPQVPQNARASAYTLVAADAGKHVSITGGGVTVPAEVFIVGDVISVFNNSASSQTITQGASTILRLAGTAGTGNRALAQYGTCSILCVAANVFVITGSGLV